MRPNRQFPIGSTVKTPLGRPAEVLSYRGDGALELRYLDGVALNEPGSRRGAETDLVCLMPGLLQALPN